jgi:aldehyde:ferredoxin oxidoreductase
MGSRNLKAIATRGTKEIPIGNREAFAKSEAKHYDLLNDSFMKVMFEAYGTAGAVDMMNVRGFFPYRNWQSGFMEDIEKINSVRLAEEFLIDNKACFACPIKCGRVVEIKTGKYAGLKGEGPEYETLGSFGGMCAINDLAAIIVAHNLCDNYGLDTISCGSTIAFAMECYEKGILTKADTGGLELRFGNADAAIEKASGIC